MSQVEFVNAASAQRRQSAPLRGGCCTNPGRCRGRQRCRDRLPMDSQQSAYAAEEALSGPPPLERPTTTERFRGFVQQPPCKGAARRPYSCASAIAWHERRSRATRVLLV